MYEIVKSVSFCYGHRLLNYVGPCQHFHGHNARAEIRLASESLDEKGMIMDFGEIKTTVKAWVDANLDHKMLLCKDDPMIPIFEQQGEPFFVMQDNPTAENIAKLIFDFTAQQGLPVASVTLWETDTSYARYSPS